MRQIRKTMSIELFVFLESFFYEVKLKVYARLWHLSSFYGLLFMNLLTFKKLNFEHTLLR